MFQEKINNRQIFYILSLMRITVAIAFLPVLTSCEAKQDAWLAAILSFFLALPIVLLISWLGISHPQETIVEYSQKLLGKWGGVALSLILVITFLFMSSGDLRIYAEIVNTGFLTNTPLSVILAVMVIISAIAAHAGIEVIARSADVLFPIFLIMVLASLVVAVPAVTSNANNLLPIFSEGFTPIFKGAIVPGAIIAQYLILTILIPKSNKPEDVGKVAVGSLFFSSIILVLFSLAVVIVLGPLSASRQLFPIFAMVRNLRISTFLERFEILTILGWGFGIFISLSTFLYCGAKVLQKVFGLKGYRFLVAPLAIIWTISSYHEFPNVFVLEEVFKCRFLGPFIFAWFLLTIFPLGLANLFKSFKKGDTNETP